MHEQTGQDCGLLCETLTDLGIQLAAVILMAGSLVGTAMLASRVMPFAPF